MLGSIEKNLEKTHKKMVTVSFIKGSQGERVKCTFLCFYSSISSVFLFFFFFNPVNSLFLKQSGFTRLGYSLKFCIFVGPECPRMV